MEDSYRQPLILEPGNCQEGKYEEKKEKRNQREVWEREVFIVESSRSALGGEGDSRWNWMELFAVFAGVRPHCHASGCDVFCFARHAC